jgi:hypothetical protein
MMHALYDEQEVFAKERSLLREMEDHLESTCTFLEDNRRGEGRGWEGGRGVAERGGKSVRETGSQETSGRRGL